MYPMQSNPKSRQTRDERIEAVRKHRENKKLKLNIESLHDPEVG